MRRKWLAHDCVGDSDVMRVYCAVVLDMSKDSDACIRPLNDMREWQEGLMQNTLSMDVISYLSLFNIYILRVCT